MKITTRGRYALRVMIYLAEHADGKYISLKEISDINNISKKYLESIMVELSRADIVEARHGKGGGYKLKKPSKSITCGEVLSVTEGGFAPVACLEENAKACPKAESCKTVKMWTDFYKLINGFFDGITVADLSEKGEDYGI